MHRKIVQAIGNREPSKTSSSATYAGAIYLRNTNIMGHDHESYQNDIVRSFLCFIIACTEESANPGAFGASLTTLLKDNKLPTVQVKPQAAPAQRDLLSSILRQPLTSNVTEPSVGHTLDSDCAPLQLRVNRLLRSGMHEPQPQAFGCWVGGWLAEWLTRARVCSVYVQLCGWQAGLLL